MRTRFAAKIGILTTENVPPKAFGVRGCGYRFLRESHGFRKTAGVSMLDHIILRIYEFNVKVTVELSDAELREILRVTREKRKGAAIRQLALEALMLKKRRELLDEAEAGKWSIDLPPIERLREDRKL